MSQVENPASPVVEPAQQQRESNRKERHVAGARVEFTTALQTLENLGRAPLRRFQMFEHVERDCCVVRLDFKLALPRLIQVNMELSYLRVSHICALVNAGHGDAEISERSADRLAVASTDINKQGAGFEREMAYEMVERGCRPLGCVYTRNKPPNVEFRVVKDLELHEPVFHGCLDALPGIQHSVDVTDFVPVVGGNRDFRNVKSGGMELHYDVGVEIESEAVVCEGDLPERRRAIGAIAAMHLRHLRAQDQVLHPRQNPVADPFVQRHPAFDSVERIDKTTAEDSVSSVLIRRQNKGESLGRILAVAVQKDDDVKALFDGV